MIGSVAVLDVHPARADVAPNPLGAHSMLQLNDPPSFMNTMFARAAAMHVSALRLDVAPSLIYTDPSAPPDFTGLDEVISLSRTYHLQLVADLMTVPWWMAACPASTNLAQVSRCGTDDLADYRAIVTQIVAHADPTIRDWEIWNEPDQPAFFAGTPQQYAEMLRAAHDAIKGVDSQANVLLGGISSIYGASWLAQVFSTPGVDAVHAFDIANVHERGRLDSLAGDLASWRHSLAAAGFTGPLWVTEHGYPSDPAFQYDPAYSAGPSSQAAYLAASVVTLIDAGASKVFVTERDNLGGQYASEGVVGGNVLDPPVEDPEVTQKPAYDAIRTIADCYSILERNCNGSAPVASPRSLAMQSARLRSTEIGSVSVSDPGPGPVRLGVVARVGSEGDPIMTQSDGCSNQLLEPDHPCTLVLRFRSMNGGEASVTLLVPSENGTLRIPLTAVAPSVSSLTSPQLHDARFNSLGGGDGVGHRQRLLIVLRNPLSAPVSVTNTALSGPGAPQFRVHNNNCHGKLAANARCRLTVLFAAARTGTATATLTIRGSGAPLHIALRATAFGAPSVTTIAPSIGTLCFGAVSRTRVLVVTDQPSSVRWRLKRRSSEPGAACRGRGGPAPRAGSRARSTASGRSKTHARSTVSGGYNVARLALPVQTSGSYLLPGSYWLTVTASNGHGTGHSRSTSVTVLP